MCQDCKQLERIKKEAFFNDLREPMFVKNFVLFPSLEGRKVLKRAGVLLNETKAITKPEQIRDEN